MELLSYRAISPLVQWTNRSRHSPSFQHHAAHLQARIKRYMFYDVTTIVKGVEFMTHTRLMASSAPTDGVGPLVSDDDTDIFLRSQNYAHHTINLSEKYNFVLLRCKCHNTMQMAYLSANE